MKPRFRESCCFGKAIVVLCTFDCASPSANRAKAIAPIKSWGWNHEPLNAKAVPRFTNSKIDFMFARAPRRVLIGGHSRPRCDQREIVRMDDPVLKLAL